MGDLVTTTAAPPGWYPDPWRQAWWRWWDGVTWTGYTDQSFAPVGTGTERAPLRAGGIAVLGFLVGLALSTAIVIAMVVAGYTENDPALLLGSTIGLWIGLGGSCVIAVRRKGSGSLADLGLVRPRWEDLALGVGFAIAAVVVVSLVAAALSAIDKSLIQHDRQDLSDPLESGRILAIFVVYLIAVVGAPFFEELYFRGLVQGTLTARYGVAIGIVVQALLFGLVHLSPDAGWANIGTYVIITIVGISLGLIRHYSGRLPPGMFTHAGYNAILVTLMLLT